MQAELPLLNQFCATTAALSKQKEHFKKRRSELVQNRSGLRSALLQYLKDNNLTCVAVPSAGREGQLYCRLKTKSCPRAITLGCIDQAWQKGGCPSQLRGQLSPAEAADAIYMAIKSVCVRTDQYADVSTQPERLVRTSIEGDPQPTPKLAATMTTVVDDLLKVKTTLETLSVEQKKVVTPMVQSLKSWGPEVRASLVSRQQSSLRVTSNGKMAAHPAMFVRETKTRSVNRLNLTILKGLIHDLVIKLHSEDDGDRIDFDAVDLKALHTEMREKVAAFLKQNRGASTRTIKAVKCPSVYN